MAIAGIAGAIAGALTGAITSALRGKFSWKEVGEGALIGAAIGLTGGAAVSLFATGSAVAYTGAVMTGLGFGGAATLGTAGATGFQQAQQLVDRTKNIPGYQTQHTSNLMDMTNEMLNTAIFAGHTGTVERIGDYVIYGNKGSVDNTFIRNVLLIETEDKGLRQFMNLVSTIEQEAIKAGASQISIGGYAIYTQGFLNHKIASAFRSVMKMVNDQTAIFLKGL